jgi:prepilin-type processing-associated H-X9-DG protein
MKPRFSHQQTTALTLSEVLVIIAVLAILWALLMPALFAAKRKPQKINCIANLKQIGVAFRLWEGDNGDKYPMAVSATNGGAMELVATGNVAACFQVMSNELSIPKILHCPADTGRIAATNFTTGFSGANISYFLIPDAVETYPQMILDGDDNLLVDGKRVQSGIINLWTNSHVGWTKDRHQGIGNVGMADGSVQQVTNEGFKWTAAPGATNRLLIP